MEQEQWYTNKDLFEMVQGLTQEMGTLKTELSETRDSIKKYNGLREQLNLCQQDLSAIKAEKRGGKEMWGYIVGALGIILALISYATK